MSYDLVVWAGGRPSSDEQASVEYQRRMHALESDDEQGAEPAAVIRAFVDAALARYPALDDDSGDECPWATAPLLDDAVGDVIFVPLTYTGAEYAREELAAIASGLGLVCYDPQAACVVDGQPNPGGPEPARHGWRRRLLGG